MPLDGSRLPRFENLDQYRQRGTVWSGDAIEDAAFEPTVEIVKF